MPHAILYYNNSCTKNVCLVSIIVVFSSSCCCGFAFGARQGLFVDFCELLLVFSLSPAAVAVCCSSAVSVVVVRLQGCDRKLWVHGSGRVIPTAGSTPNNNNNVRNTPTGSISIPP